MTTAKKLPDLDILLKYLEYNPETGVFFRKYRSDGFKTNRDMKIFNSRFANKETGYIGKDNRVYIRIDAHLYLAHRLAWKIIIGTDPKNQIDHINMNPSDNRFCNLREADNSENNCNKIEQSNNKCGFKGVCFDQSIGKFKARITKNGEHIHIGVFDNVLDAHVAYCKHAALIHYDFANFGAI